LALLAEPERRPLPSVRGSAPLPWSLGGNRWQRTATVFAYLSRPRPCPICHRLPLVATAGLHKASIHRCLSWRHTAAVRAPNSALARWPDFAALPSADRHARRRQRGGVHPEQGTTRGQEPSRRRLPGVWRHEGNVNSPCAEVRVQMSRRHCDVRAPFVPLRWPLARGCLSAVPGAFA
jgi:hypothetical protein